MVEILVVQLNLAFEHPALAEGRAHGEAAARVVIVALLVGKGGGRVSLSRVRLELIPGQGARQVLFVVGEAPVQAERGAARQDVAEARAGTVASLLAVDPVAVEPRVGVGQIEIQRPVDLTGGDVVLEEAERARLAAQPQQALVIARLADEVHRAAQRVGAEA